MSIEPTEPDKPTESPFQRPAKPPLKKLPPENDISLRRLPFHWSWPMLVGAGVALLLRVAFFGGPGQGFSPMLGSFVYLAPAVCGAVTVYMAERVKRRTWGYYIWTPWVSTCLFVCGTLLVFIEGIICAVLIVPLFAMLGTVGGLAMGAVCRVTNWPKPALYSFALLPLLLGGIEPQLPNPTSFPRPRARSSLRRRPSACGTRSTRRATSVLAKWATRGPSASACRCRCPA